MVADGEVLGVTVFAEGGLTSEVVSAGTGGVVLTAVNTGAAAAGGTEVAAGNELALATVLDSGGGAVVLGAVAEGGADFAICTCGAGCLLAPSPRSRNRT